MVTQVKICGITNLEDALVAVEAGADMLGFIFYEPSPRYVQPEVVREIVSGVRGQVSSVRCQVSGEARPETGDGGRKMVNLGPRSSVPGLTFVGVFVNSPLETVAHILDFCGLDVAQLHGEESPEFVAHFQGRAFKALRPQSLEEAESLIQKYMRKDEGGGRKDERIQIVTRSSQSSNVPTFQRSNVPTFLFDAYHPHLYGGTGQVADWGMAAAIARRYPILLAGSLTPENVAEAVRVVRPWGVDVSSGVEREKGKKDHAKVRALVETVRSVTAVKAAGQR